MSSVDQVDTTIDCYRIRDSHRTHAVAPANAGIQLRASEIPGFRPSPEQRTMLSCRVSLRQSYGPLLQELAGVAAPNLLRLADAEEAIPRAHANLVAKGKRARSRERMAASW